MGSTIPVENDLEIGAIELKNADTDDRAKISDANTARAATDHVLEVQHLDATGKVSPAGDAVGNAPFAKITDGTDTALITAGGSQNVLDDNSAAIKTAVELIDDAVYTDGAGTPGKGILVMGTDGTNPQALSVNSDGELIVNLEAADIEIGAVEIKNATTDDRVLVSDANTARAVTDHVLEVQHLDATGKVQPAGEIVTNPVHTAVGDGTTTAVVETAGTKKALNVNVSDGTNDMPTMDAVARRGFVGLTDGTNDADIDPANTARATTTVVQAVQHVDATGKVQPAGEVVTNPIHAAIGDGAQTVDVETVEADIDGKNAVTTNALMYGKESAGVSHPVSVDAAGVVQVNVANDAEVATTPTIYNVAMTLADTEYSQALPAGTKILEFRCQENGFDVRYAFETGKVATPTAPYRSLFSGEVKTVERLNLTTKTLYFACGTAGKTLEIEVWS